MAIIHGTVRNGGVVPDSPVELPEGTRVQIRPVPEADQLGIPEEEQGDDPESIAAWIAWADTIQPLVMSPEEEAAWQKGLADQKAFELATWEERAEKLRKLFE